MTINNSAKTSTRRGKRTPQSDSPPIAAETTVEATAISAENTVKKTPSEASKEESMASDNLVKISARPAQADVSEPEGSIQLHQSSEFSDGSPMSSDIEIAGTYSEAGIRPVGISSLELYDSYLNGRPISASHLQIFEMLPGDRPVFVSEIKMVEGLALADHRPVMESDPKLLIGSYLPGNRPIASNEIDDSTTLMGFID